MKTNANRILYLFYYFRKLDRKKLQDFLSFSSKETGQSKLTLLFHAIGSVFKYNISILDYFYFRFFEKDDRERLRWAGTGFMYEYQKKMNPLDAREVLENKISFSKQLSQFYKRDIAEFHSINEDDALAYRFIDNPSGKLVLKNSTGQAGQEIKVLECKDLSPLQLRGIMRKGKFDLLEEYIVQHPEMMRLSPAGLNTVRIISQENGGIVDIIAARLRISINSHVDNMAAGNAAVPLNKNTGCVTGSGVFSDISRADISVHPVTGVELVGFKVPCWKEIIEMVNEAALMVKDNRSIGWDVAINPEGPLLVEGNHNWCKLLWQLPVKKGLKMELEGYQ